MRLISIIIPCYNHGKFIGDCFDSLIAQTYQNIEILLADDASTDNSWDIIQKYRGELENRFSRVVLKRNIKNKGLTSNLNALIELAQGDIIKTIASDDFLDEHFCETIERLFSEYKPDIVLTNAYLVGEQSRYGDVTYIGKYYNDDPFAHLKGRVFESLFKRNYLCAPSIALDSKVYEKYGLYDETLYAEDLDYWLNITKDDSITFFYCESPLVFYRQNSESMSSKSKNNNLEKRLIRMHNNSIDTRIKYKQYLSKYKYNLYMLKTILYYYKISKKDNLLLLKEHCEKDAKLLCAPFRIMFHFRKRIL